MQLIAAGLTRFRCALQKGLSIPIAETEWISPLAWTLLRETPAE